MTRQISALFFAVIMSCPGWAETLDERLETIRDELNQFTSIAIRTMNLETSRKLAQIYADSFHLFDDIMGSDREDKAELSRQLMDDVGKSFELITEPFADVYHRPTYDDVASPYSWTATNMVKWAAYNFGWLLGTTFRDFLRLQFFSFDEDAPRVEFRGRDFSAVRFHLPFVTPFFGADWHRSARAKQVAKLWADRVYEAIKKGEAPQTSDPLAQATLEVRMQSLKQLYEQLSDSEPIVAGNTNRNAFWIFAVGSVWWFFHPPFDLAITPTAYSIDDTANFGAFFLATLAFARNYDSALGARHVIMKARKLVDESKPMVVRAWNACAAGVAAVPHLVKRVTPQRSEPPAPPKKATSKTVKKPGTGKSRH